ncbi:hypothetical protein E1180_21920 [Roseibium denhamense]|uniref:DUF3108 domain-containing protein n=1 Tax=Roseibium denhamense TaxID=76305 RepID=A0ABY1NSC4_9HYPH|nr:hypothetical protein [Roseibium denhamense]MTI08162.1 hypothetical protein [Roseibium denhamense]SMP16962.1 hypothetical protein SAMN06265374_1759 [Roseibium denhamense]
MYSFKSFCIRLGFAAGLLIAGGASAHAGSVRIYSVELDGKHVGQILHEYSRLPDGAHDFQLTTKIEAKAFFRKVRITSVLKETISANGFLDEASNKLVENKKTYWTKIQRSGDSYLAFTAQMKTPQELEIEEVAGLAKEVIATVVPYAGEAMTIAGILLLDERGSPQHKRLTTDHFETSLIGLPLYWQSRNYVLPKTLTIIDTEEMSVFKAAVTDLGDTQVSLGGRPVTARQIRLKIANSKPMEIWMIRPETGPAYFFQIKGKSDGASFKVSLKNAH